MSKYKNPIVKLETVKIPTWEYANLIRESTLLRMMEKLVNGLDEYRVRDTLKVLFDNGEGEEE